MVKRSDETHEFCKCVRLLVIDMALIRGQIGDPLASDLGTLLLCEFLPLKEFQLLLMI